MVRLAVQARTVLAVAYDPLLVCHGQWEVAHHVPALMRADTLSVVCAWCNYLPLVILTEVSIEGALARELGMGNSNLG